MTSRPKIVLTLLGLDAVVILAVVGQLALALGSPATPGLRVAEGTVAPERASMTIEPNGNRVVTVRADPRPHSSTK